MSENSRATSSALTAIQPKLLILILGLCCLCGIFFRLYHITQYQFTYYDEGEYLNHGRKLTEFIEHLKPLNAENFKQGFVTSLKFALNSNKFLWYALVDWRVFFMPADAWSYTRVVAAVFGILTCWPLYLLGKWFFKSRLKALWAVVILALLPSHIYYSRLGMQETLSAFLYTWGLYFYVTARTVSVKTFVSAAFMVCAYFTNYRLIILPFHVAVAELAETLAQKRVYDFRKVVWHTVFFFAAIFLVGSLENGANTVFTFFWMFNQQNLAHGHFSFLNLFSFPYYFIRFEGLLFTLLLFSSAVFFFQRRWDKVFPFALIIFQVGVFSIFQEKGVRYLCIVYPLVALAAVAVLDEVRKLIRQPRQTQFVYIIIIVIIAGFFLRDIQIINFETGYAQAVAAIKKKDPGARILTSQPLVLNLYAAKDDIASLPADAKNLPLLLANGYRYIVLDPQAYISYTKDGLRFSPQLRDYLETARQKVHPVATFNHFNNALLERFVLEHNEDLARSIEFLNTNRSEHFSSIFIYDVKELIVALMAAERSR